VPTASIHALVHDCAADPAAVPRVASPVAESDRAPAGPVFYPAAASTPRILVLGLGNDILTDDAVGLLAVRELRAGLAGRHPLPIDVCETTEMGLALLDFLVGYQTVILVDAIQTGRAPVGTVHELDAPALRRLAGVTPHFLGVGETLALGRQLGLPMPTRVLILAIEVADPFTVGTTLTPPLQAALPAILGRLWNLVLELADPWDSDEVPGRCPSCCGQKQEPMNISRRRLA